MILKHSRWLVVLLMTLGLFVVACSSNDSNDDGGDDNGNSDAEEPTRDDNEEPTEDDGGNGGDEEPTEDDGGDGEEEPTEDEDDNGGEEDEPTVEDDGDNGDGGSGSEIIDRARERAEEQAANPESGESYAFEMNATFDGLEVDPETTEGVEIDVSEFALVGDGAVDPANQRSRFTFTIEGFDTGDLGDFGDFGDIEDFFTFETIQDGDVLYTKNAFLTLFGGGDEDTWVRTDSGAAPDDLGQPLDVPGFDAGSQLDALQGLSDDFEEVGEEEIRGVNTTHVRATIDAERLQEELEENLDDPEVAEDLGDLYGEDVTLDLWLDDDGRVHRMEAEYSFAGTAAEEAAGAGIDFSNATMHMVIEYFDYGDDVAIEIPSEDQVVDEEDLFGGFGDLLTPEEE